MNEAVKSNKPFSERCREFQGGWCQNRWARRLSLGRREASHCRSTETLEQKEGTTETFRFKLAALWSCYTTTLTRTDPHTPRFMQQTSSVWPLISVQPYKLMQKSLKLLPSWPCNEPPDTSEEPVVEKLSRFNLTFSEQEKLGIRALEQKIEQFVSQVWFSKGYPT